MCILTRHLGGSNNEKTNSSKLRPFSSNYFSTKPTKSQKVILPVAFQNLKYTAKSSFLILVMRKITQESIVKSVFS